MGYQEEERKGGTSQNTELHGRNLIEFSIRKK
jgi:hypothetical protein